MNDSTREWIPIIQGWSAQREDERQSSKDDRSNEGMNSQSSKDDRPNEGMND